MCIIRIYPQCILNKKYKLIYIQVSNKRRDRQTDRGSESECSLPTANSDMIKGNLIMNISELEYGTHFLSHDRDIAMSLASIRPYVSS